jgi:hypothetical protein
MAKTLGLYGHEGSLVYVRKDAIISMVPKPVDQQGAFGVYIKTEDGGEYYAWFTGRNAQMKFVNSWAGEIEDLSVKPEFVYEVPTAP